MKTIESLLLSVGLLILRLVFGGVMLVAHGWGKLMNYSETLPGFANLGGHAGLIGAIGAEVGCAALLMLGLFTRVAAAPLAITMIVAAFVVHAEHDFATKEKAILFLAAYLALVFTGGGAFSLDSLLWRNKTKK